MMDDGRCVMVDGRYAFFCGTKWVTILIFNYQNSAFLKTSTFLEWMLKSFVHTTPKVCFLCKVFI